MPQIGDIKRGKEIGKLGDAKHIWHACIDCGKERWVHWVKGKAISPRCRSCAGKLKCGLLCGDKHPQWKGGRQKTTEGYFKVRVEPDDLFYSMTQCDGYILEHRLVMAQHLGRLLRRYELVHHLNGIKGDNRPSNLALTNSKKHDPKSFVKALQSRIRELEQLHLSLRVEQ